MKTDKHFIEDNISEVLNNPSKVTQIIQAGIRDALIRHKQAGNQICVWRDNKVMWIPPEKILINQQEFPGNSEHGEAGSVA